MQRMKRDPRPLFTAQGAWVVLAWAHIIGSPAAWTLGMHAPLPCVPCGEGTASRVCALATSISNQAALQHSASPSAAPHAVLQVLKCFYPLPPWRPAATLPPLRAAWSHGAAPARALRAADAGKAVQATALAGSSAAASAALLRSPLPAATPLPPGALHHCQMLHTTHGQQAC